MPLVDMPLEELKVYKPGLNRRKDFAAFWSKACGRRSDRPVG